MSPQSFTSPWEVRFKDFNSKLPRSDELDSLGRFGSWNTMSKGATKEFEPQKKQF